MTKDEAISLSGQVAIVTGAGQGLGRAHALALAERGACLMVNDADAAAGAAVAAEIVARGGQALSSAASVADEDAVADMVGQALAAWGRIDILVNNAGILRDRSFAKMTPAEYRAVVDVHLMGTIICCRAVWNPMRARGYGRIVMTSSSSGLYGNFGQSNYAAAKMGVVGLMNSLAIEGARDGIRVNTLAPMARTAMTTGVVAESAAFERMTADSVAVGVVLLCAPQAPDRSILCAGGGSFSLARLFETRGIFLPPDRLSPEALLAAWDAVGALDGAAEYRVAREQTVKFMDNMRAHIAGETPDSASGVA